MENNKTPNRASQTSKSDSTKVETQAKTVAPKERPKVWTPPSYLDTPNAPNGFRHRWVRTEILGFVDTKNIQGRLRSGYELVRAEEIENASDYPVIESGKYKGMIGVGGLLLAKVTEEIAQARTDYVKKRADGLDEAVTNDLMREQHKSMPINVDRQSRVTFGGTKKS